MRNIRFTHATGRHYDKAQELAIDAAIPPFGDEMMVRAIATFVDASRHISGRVTIWVCEFDNQAAIGRAVLAEYDNGRYELI